ncbi:ABC-three component system protein [Rhodopirellula halodulae]|uniref:ABC-three component system protein n=1 Tax=Rhodopirellula halodulae TaxID=2894198 RepID=UPI001E5E9A91|nr:ABC-three component system protein [Rhodopirellula sp. JC737]MCC9658303.1 hypothetical protein [Rhodopirellula sp. JC737]
MTKHDAAGPAAGYLFQPEKALLRLAKAPRSAWVGVETGDDVVEMLDGVVTDSEQLKNTVLGQGNPFADRSVGLWKTLSIWISALEVEPERVNNSQLILSTNRKIPSNCLAKMLADAREPESIQEAVQQLRYKGNTPSDAIREFVEIVERTDDDTLHDIVGRIRIDDGTELSNSIKVDTIEYLQLPSNVDGPHVYDSLLGWLNQTLKQLWDACEPGWISGEAFANQKHAVIDNCHRESLSARAACSISVSDSERNAKKNDLFVMQLQLIDADDDETIDAINDLIRESKEIFRLCQRGLITKPEFVARDARLYERWKRIARRHKRSPGERTDQQIGYFIYDDATDHDEPLGKLRPIDRYMTSGAFHRLANDLDSDFFVGWHPSFKKLLKTLEESSVL